MTFEEDLERRRIVFPHTIGYEGMAEIRLLLNSEDITAGLQGQFYLEGGDNSIHYNQNVMLERLNLFRPGEGIAQSGFVLDRKPEGDHWTYKGMELEISSVGHSLEETGLTGILDSVRETIEKYFAKRDSQE